MVLGLILAVALAAIGAAAVAAPPAALGTITILEGSAYLYRGTGRLHAAEGVRVVAGDLVETAENSFVQIEMAPGVVQFGPHTQAMLDAPRRGPGPWMYLLEGWAKVSQEVKDGQDGLELRTPLAMLSPTSAVAVLHMQSPSESPVLTVFAERGGLRLVEMPAARPPTALALRAGQHWQRRAGQRGAVNPGAMAGLLQGMPRQFRDSLPLRAERFRDRVVAPKAADAFGYDDVQAWLQAEPALRRPFVQRWRVKAREPAFRRALVSNLAAHPEWDPVLFPEKYLPKEPPRRAASAAAR